VAIHRQFVDLLGEDEEVAATRLLHEIGARFARATGAQIEEDIARARAVLRAP
jgi:hypothetical protein